MLFKMDNIAVRITLIKNEPKCPNIKMFNVGTDYWVNIQIAI